MKRIVLRLLGLCSGVFLLSAPSHSDTDFEDLLTLSLDELMQVEVYTASQENEKAAKSPASISVITAQQIKEWGIINLHDAISLLPGIVKGETNLGQTTQTFRGVTPGLFNNKSLYLINGHPSYESLFGSTLLDYVPIEIVERIEVVRSPASVLYGTNSISGVLNIITKQGEDNKDTVTVRGGSNSHKYGSLVHHSENLSMAASVQRDAGYLYSGTLDEEGAPVDLDYRYDLENVFIDGYGEDWRINAAIFDREKALFGINPVVWQNGIFETFVGYVDVNKKFSFDTGELNLWLRYDISDKDIHVDHFPMPTSNPVTVINTVERYSLEVQFKNQITENLKYIVGTTIEQQESEPLVFISRIDGSMVTSAIPDDQDTNTISAYTQIKYQMSEDTIFVVGIRAEDNSENGTSDFMPKLGMTHQVIPDTYIKVLYSEAFRTPMFIEKYVNLSSVLFGDENLERETIKTVEVGLDSTINKDNQVQFVIYSLNLEDEILRFPEPFPSTAAIYRNGEGKEMTGIEAEWKSIISKQFELIFNAAYVDGEDKSLGEDDAPLIANETFNAILTYHINNNWSTTLTAQHVGEKDVVSSVTSVRSTLDSYQLYNLTTVYRMKQHELRLIFSNISDETYTYPEPVRRIIPDVPGGADFAAYAQYQFSF